MRNTTLKPDTAVIERLRRDQTGTVIVPGDDAYDGARSVYFTGFDRRPVAVVRAAHAEDVARTVSIVHDAGVPLAVRGGGHSPAGHGVCDGGIVLDLSALRSLDIDPDGRSAWAGTGLTAGEYTAATAPHGLVTGFGDAPSVGIGGITLAGGIGFLHRRLGMTIDSLLAAEIVTADGRIRYVDDESEPDLFWAIRGGGGNFGVVTRLRFRLHPIDHVMGGMLLLPATPESIVAAIEAAFAAGDELSGIINVALAPPMPFLPPETHGRPIIMAMLVHATGGEAGERAFAPFRALGPIADMIRPMQFAQIYEGAEHAPRPKFTTIRTQFVDGIDRAAADTILDAVHASTAPMSVAQYRILGGAVSRVSADATAFPYRSRGALLNVATMFEDGEQAAEHAAWASTLASRLRQGEPGAYIGFLDAEGSRRLGEICPSGTWQRLTAVKNRVDPDNIFRFNANVTPAERTAPARRSYRPAPTR